MNIQPGSVIRFLICLTIFICPTVSQTTAQQTINSTLPSEFSRSKVMTPFFEKENAVGSPYLSRVWMQGVVVLTNNKVLPLLEQPLLFNFDKVSYRLYFVNAENRISFYAIDSVKSANLTDGNTIYPFEKVSWISNDFFLFGLTRSEKGYSLYKRMFTRLIPADYSNGGYYSKGNKFDEYVDYYEYYITFPGNNTYKKLYPGMKNIRQALRKEAKLVKDFFTLHDDDDINEQSLIAIIQFLNDKKYSD